MIFGHYKLHTIERNLGKVEALVCIAVTKYLTNIQERRGLFWFTVWSYSYCGRDVMVTGAQ